MCRRDPGISLPSTQSGSTTVEYVVVGMFVIATLLAGPNVIHTVWSALQKAYTAFYYAISAAT